MKKLIAILLMLSLLMCLFTCFAAAEAPVADTESESEVGGADAPENHEFKFEPSQFVDNLYYMGVGMVGIFLVIGIIILATVALNRIFSGKAKE
ncbi:MAG: hypothetical protein IKC97_08110 [Clostridia bacterium]|nr:hypothetical protein [Clostridia bacterium]